MEPDYPTAHPTGSCVCRRPRLWGRRRRVACALHTYVCAGEKGPRETVMCVCQLCASPREVRVCVPGGRSGLCGYGGVVHPLRPVSRPRPSSKPSSTCPSALHSRRAQPSGIHTDTHASSSPSTTSCLSELVFVSKSGVGWGQDTNRLTNEAGSPPASSPPPCRRLPCPSPSKSPPSSSPPRTRPRAPRAAPCRPPDPGLTGGVSPGEGGCSERPGVGGRG